MECFHQGLCSANNRMNDKSVSYENGGVCYLVDDSKAWIMETDSRNTITSFLSSSLYESNWWHLGDNSKKQGDKPPTVAAV